MKKKLLFLVAMICILPIYVLASSYNITFDFKVGLTSSVRYFSGSNISVYTNSSANVTDVKIFYLTLERVHKTLFVTTYDKIGTVTHPRNGAKTSTWTNVGAGNYIIEFSKANDGIYVKGSGSFYN